MNAVKKAGGLGDWVVYSLDVYGASTSTFDFLGKGLNHA